MSIQDRIQELSLAKANNEKRIIKLQNQIDARVDEIRFFERENSEITKLIFFLIEYDLQQAYTGDVDGDGNLTSARTRIYSVPGSVGTVNDVIGTYEITAPGNGAGKFTSWKQVKA